MERYSLAGVALCLRLHLVLAVFGCEACMEARQTLDGEIERQIQMYVCLFILCLLMFIHTRPSGSDDTITLT